MWGSFLPDRAAEAYQAAGAEDDEFRVRQRRGANSERYLELLLKRQPDRLIALAASGGGSRVNNRAANYAVARGGVDLALRAVAARCRRLPPVWTKAYRGLVGLHYSRLAPEIDDAFAEILDSGAISQRIGQPLDRDQELAGDLWYYYGARYGEYLLLDGRPEAEDYLPALLEGASARVSAYSDLANYYREEGAYDDALADYRHVLELQPGNAEARIASNETPEASARALTETASSTGAEYESRVAAAKLLRRIGAKPLDLGSEELDVLASDVAPASHAFRDYDYHSRLAASERAASAQNTDSQLQLLRDALAIRPEAITPRVAAFRAARQTADHTLALAALMPLINQTGLGQQLFKQDSVFSETRNQDKLQPWMADQFLSRNGLDNRERATIARELGDSAEILGRLDAASLHFQLALKMGWPPPKASTCSWRMRPSRCWRRLAE